MLDEKGSKIMSASVVKWGGGAGILAAVLFVLSAIIYQIAPGEGIINTSSEYFYRAVTVLAYLAVIVAILGIHALHRGNSRYGRLGTAGSVITIASYAMIAVLTLISMVQDFEYLPAIQVVPAGLVLIGSLLLGVIVLRARLLPWWCGVLLIVAFPLGHFANAIFSSAENLLLALLWGSVGVALVARREGAVEAASQPAQTS
jgi:hypothetical protein